MIKTRWWGTRTAVSALALAVALVGLAEPGLARPGDLLRPPPAAPGDDEASAALSAASSARRATRGLDDGARLEALMAVVSQYDAIVARSEFAAGARAEAAFRAGEILRSLARTEEARARFDRALELGAEDEQGQEFAARGLLELAHIQRREDELEAALATYAEVGRRFEGQRRSCAHAATWTGKLLLRSGQIERGEAVLMGFAGAFPEYPAEAVRNADLVAVERLDEGDEAGAREIVERIRSALEPVLVQGGKPAEQALEALEKMKVTGRLPPD
jgi:tetratricopeptide (TPR) repeat protein